MNAPKIIFGKKFKETFDVGDLVSFSILCPKEKKYKKIFGIITKTQEKLVCATDKRTFSSAMVRTNEGITREVLLLSLTLEAKPQMNLNKIKQVPQST